MKKTRLAISSELPYLRRDFWEVLDHSPGSIVMDRLRDGVALLYNHDRDAHLGIVNAPQIGPDRILRGDAAFAPTTFAQEKKASVDAGTLPWVSVSYNVLKSVRQQEYKDGFPIERVTKWEPLEISLVTIPADPTVGVGREAIDHYIRQRSDSLPTGGRERITENFFQNYFSVDVALDESELERLRLRVMLAYRLE